MKEYVIWGKPENSKNDSLLLTSINGEKITDLKTAKKYQQILETKYNCKNCRIQEIDFTKPYKFTI